MTESTDVSQLSPSKIAFIFPGQGSQTVGMGKQLFEKYPSARQAFEEADDALGYKLSQVCFEGPEQQLRLTEITQPAILAGAVSGLKVLGGRGPKAEFGACPNLGEDSAQVASGTMTFVDALRT